MNKNSVISMFLLAAFTFLLAHNFIPHHHHVNVAESEHHEHHSHGHGHHHHHHDKDDHKKKQEEKSHDEKQHDTHFSLSDFVFIHSDLTNLYSKRKNTKTSYPTGLLAVDSEQSHYGLRIKEKPPLIRCKELIQPYFYCLSHRGPPSIS